jgi:hypothetical protein
VDLKDRPLSIQFMYQTPEEVVESAEEEEEIDDFMGDMFG